MKYKLQHIVLGLVLALLITNAFAEENEQQHCSMYCTTIGQQTNCTQICY